FEAALDRFAGPLAVTLLGAAVILLVERGPAVPCRYATLLLGVVLLTELGWAALDPGVPAVALHRNVLLMTALAVTTVAYGVGLARVAGGGWRVAGEAALSSPATGHPPPGTQGWAECGRRCGPVLGVLALAVLVGVLGQEFLLYNPDPEVKR